MGQATSTHGERGVRQIAPASAEAAQLASSTTVAAGPPCRAAAHHAARACSAGCRARPDAVPPKPVQLRRAHGSENARVELGGRVGSVEGSVFLSSSLLSSVLLSLAGRTWCGRAWAKLSEPGPSLVRHFMSLRRRASAQSARSAYRRVTPDDGTRIYTATVYVSHLVGESSRRSRSDSAIN